LAEWYQIACKKRGRKSLSHSISLDNYASKAIHPNKIAIYIRWSTDEQEKGNTLSIQLESCKHYIESQGWQINNDLIYIDDGYTGSNLKRPGITKLREDVKNGLIDCIVVWKIDRLSRSVVDTVSLVLDEWQYLAYIKSVNELFDTSTPMGVLVLSILAIFAQIERETIRTRTWNGKVKQITEKGLNPGVKAPYGYKNGKVKGTYEIIEEEALIVRRIFSDYCTGLGMLTITARLNEERIPFRQNSPWNKGTVGHILCNELYIGTMIWGKTQVNEKYGKVEGEKSRNRRENPIIKEFTEDVLPPIISKEEFRRVKSIRESKDAFSSGTSGRTYSSSFLLSGLLRCTCGATLWGKRTKNRKHGYYMCTGQSTKGKTQCDSSFLREDLLDKYVVESVINVFLTGGNENIQLHAIEQINNKFKELTIALDGINKRLKVLAKSAAEYENNLLLDDNDPNKLTVGRYNSLMTRIDNEITELEKKRRDIQEQLKAIQQTETDTEEFITTVDSLEKWDELSKVEQKQLISCWVSGITAYKKSGSHTLSLAIDYKTKVSEQVTERLWIPPTEKDTATTPSKEKYRGWKVNWSKDGEPISREEYNKLKKKALAKGQSAPDYLN